MSLINRINGAFENTLIPHRSTKIINAGKWTFYFFAIGVIAGLGAVVFHYLCLLGSHYFLDMMAGYRPPSPAGEHHLMNPTNSPFNRWILLVLPALGGILSGWIVYSFAPEAEGHGTDAAIYAYHHDQGLIRSRVPFIKTIASAITLTTGGSGGREGPIAQIGAGFGSFLATRLKLTERERRIMMAAGISAGVGSIFRAPLAGALFAAEVLYKDPDIEPEIIIPAGISSVVSYCLFCFVYGWGSLFNSPDFVFRNPIELGPYLFLALVLSGLGFLYVKSFYSTIDIFHRLKVPNHIKPAIGGLLTGMIGFFWPYTLSFGYGFAQMALNNELTIPFLLTLAFGKIFTTSFSIGSGGSGGVFGPSIVIGGAMGGAVGRAFNHIMPSVITEPGSFVVVGMAGFFAGVSNTPISTIIFVSEMTNSYHLLLPSLLVCAVCYLSSRHWTIFHNQVQNKIESPAHTADFFVDVLQAFQVQDLMDSVRPVKTIPEDMSFADFRNFFCENQQLYFPVVNKQGRLVRIFSVNDVRGHLLSTDKKLLTKMDTFGTREIITTFPGEDLNSALHKFTIKNLDSLPVVDDSNHDLLIGMLNRREVIAFYNSQVREMTKQAEPKSIR
jgi:CIC family chloride channel protein